MNFDEKLSGVVTRFDEVQALLSSPDTSTDELVKLNKEISVLEPVVAAINNYQKQLQSFKDAEEMMQDSSLDKEMRDLAEMEYYELKEKLPELEKEIKVLLLPKDEEDEKNAILEVRAGTGGDEAALFAAVLFEMYQRYAQNKGGSLRFWTQVKMVSVVIKKLRQKSPERMFLPNSSLNRGRTVCNVFR